jgi:Ankyrin repeats (3 copies)
MGNVQQSYSSPFIFRPCDIPPKPFAAEKQSSSRRRAQMVSQKSGDEDRGAEEESSTTSSILSSTGNNTQFRLSSPSYRTILQQLIELQDWQRVLCRMELYPDEVNQTFPIFVDTSTLEPPPPNNLSRTFKASNHHAIIFATPLHLVCALNPPLVVVTTILRLGGSETASMSIRPNSTRNKRTLKKLFWQHRRIRSSGRNNGNRRSRNQHSDNQSQKSDTPSLSSEWQTLQSSSSDSSAWNHKINFRFSFDDYKRRVKYAIIQRRSRGGAFPIVEELNEDSSEDDHHDSQYSSGGRHDSYPQKETQPSSLAAGKIAHAVTSDCSHSHQSSVSATPPRSSISDQSVILQLSSSGGVRPLPLRKNETSEEQLGIESPYTPTTALIRKCQPHQSTDSTKHSSCFRVHWDLNPLLRHALEEGSLLPLHVAVLYSASSDIILALVDAYPLAALRDVFGMLPIHFVAAGWLLPPLLPPPVSVTIERIQISNDPETIDHTLLLQNLTVLQQAVPDSVRIRSGNNGMKPEEYINECMEDSSYKDECLRVLQEGLNILPRKEATRLFDIDTSITSSSDDIFDFNDTMHSSADDYTDGNLEINPPAPSGSEPPFEYLSSLMAARDWQSVNVAIAMYPSLAAQWIFGIDDASASIYKRLPLHCACIYGGPIELIDTLINLFPEGIQTIDPTDSSTPLSLACFANNSIKIIRLILRSYPQAIDIVNIYGQVPLHVAILSKVSHDVVELLVEESPHLVLLKDNDGLNSINYAKIVYGEEHTVYQFLLMIKDGLLSERVH